MAFITLSQSILAAALAKNTILTAAESCTGGLLAGAITEAAGASAIFERGFVTYSNRAKQDMLGVQSDTLHRYGAVSEQVALEMADGALNRAQADLALSITGIAGPGASEHKPEGRVCFGVAQLGRATWAETVEFGALGRSQVRLASVDHGLTLILGALS